MFAFTVLAGPLKSKKPDRDVMDEAAVSAHAGTKYPQADGKYKVIECFI